MPRRTRPARRVLASLLMLPLLALTASLTLQPAATQAAPELRATYRISGSNFLKAFREVVDQPRTWTVRIRRQHPRTERWSDAALGVVVRSDGLVVTKASEAMGPLRVKLPDLRQRMPDAEIVALDKDLDLALLQIDMTGLDPLPTVAWADATGPQDDPAVGRWLVTPSIYSTPAAVGIVSVPRRVIPRTELPGMLGVTFRPQRRESIVRGGEVADLVEDGPADRAGLVVGDTILSVDGESTPIYSEVVGAISRRRPGDVITLRVRREDATTEEIAVRLAQPNTQLLELRGMRFDMMNGLGGKLSERRSNFPAAIQHDSVLEPTDCGGAAVNLDGEAVGLNIARAGRTESLLLPADVARVAIDRLVRRVDR